MPLHSRLKPLRMPDEGMRPITVARYSTSSRRAIPRDHSGQTVSCPPSSVSAPKEASNPS